MNKALSIVLLFLFACHSSDDKTIAFFDGSIEKCNKYLSYANDRFYTDAESYKMMNPIKNKEFKNNIDKIRNLSDTIFSSIEKRKLEITGNIPINKKLTEPNPLFDNLSKYINLLNRLFPYDTIIKKKIKAELFNEKTKLKNLTIYELNLLTCQIQNINFTILLFFTKKMETSGSKFDTSEVLIIPKEKYLETNEIYSADIYLASLSTSSNFSVKIGSRTFESENGKVLYVDSTRNKPKLIKKHCSLEIILLSTGNKLIFPFYLKYQFKEK